MLAQHVSDTVAVQVAYQLVLVEQRHALVRMGSMRRHRRMVGMKA
jgi:hypothetical protein